MIDMAMIMVEGIVGMIMSEVGIDTGTTDTSDQTETDQKATGIGTGIGTGQRETGTGTGIIAIGIATIGRGTKTVTRDIAIETTRGTDTIASGEAIGTERGIGRGDTTMTTTGSASGREALPSADWSRRPSAISGAVRGVVRVSVDCSLLSRRRRDGWECALCMHGTMQVMLCYVRDVCILSRYLIFLIPVDHQTCHHNNGAT